MATFIGLLRGINVGGKNMLPMAELRRIVEATGGADVRTYIQSGNVVFEAKKEPEAKLAARLRAAIKEDAGVDCAVVLRTPKELAAVVAESPFTDVAHVHVVFRESATKVAFDDANYAPEELRIVGREIYLYLPNGIGRSKLAADVARKKDLRGTARNWRTVTKLLAMAEG